MGTNTLLGLAPERIVEVPDLLEGVRRRPISVPPGWDGRAAERLVDVLEAGVPDWDDLGGHRRVVAPGSFRPASAGTHGE
jgi:hypothetical protein